MKPYYEHAGITIYHGDCRYLVPSLPLYGLLLTDPPYGIRVDEWMSKDSGNRRGTMLAKKGIYTPTAWDKAPPDAATLEMLVGHCRRAIVWGGNFFALPPSRGWLVWDKENGDNKFADCELAWTNIDMPIRRKAHMWNGMLRKGGEARYGHPTQKPLELMYWCLTFSDETEILDPFMGSGTTLVAAKNMGRQAVGIDAEERYCEIAAKRLSQEILPGVA